MGDRSDAGHELHQFHVLRCRGEGVVRDHRTVGLAAELAELRRIDVLVQAGLEHLRAVLEVVEQLALGAVEHLDPDVLPEVGPVDEELEPPPSRFKLLESLVMEDFIELCGKLAVDGGDHLVDDRIVDLLVLPGGLHQLRDEGGHAAAGDVVAVVLRSELGLADDLIEQRFLGRDERTVLDGGDLLGAHGRSCRPREEPRFCRRGG